MKHGGGFDTWAVKLTEARIDAIVAAVRAGSVDVDKYGRRTWRDAGTNHGLHLTVGRRGATFVRIAKVGNRLTRQRIGPADAISLKSAREQCLQLAAGNDSAKAAPIRISAAGGTIEDTWQAYVEASRQKTFYVGHKPPQESTLNSYRENYEPHIGRPYGNRSLADLGTLYPKIHRSLASKPDTQKRVRQLVKNLFSFARSNGNWSGVDPTIDPTTAKPYRCEKATPRTRVFKTTELRRLLHHTDQMPGRWPAYWRLLLLTMIRKTTLMGMKWSDVDLESRPPTWTLEQTKNGPHTVALSKPAAAILRQLEAGRNGSDFVFPMAGDPTRPISDVDHSWAALKKAAGLSGVRIHDIRRTAATLALRGGMSLPAVQRAGNWKSITAAAVYARAELRDGLEASETVANFVDELEGGKNAKK